LFCRLRVVMELPQLSTPIGSIRPGTFFPVPVPILQQKECVLAMVSNPPTTLHGITPRSMRPPLTFDIAGVRNLMVDASSKVKAIQEAMQDSSVSEANKSIGLLNLSIFSVLEALIEKVIIPSANNHNSGIALCVPPPPCPPNRPPDPKNLGKPLPPPTEPPSSSILTWVASLSATDRVFLTYLLLGESYQVRHVGG
jgi:hypothetical protein